MDARRLVRVERLVVGVAIAGDLCSGALIPDVVVSHRTDRPRRIVPGETVELAVEVVSPSSRANDRRTKPLLYATAGIRHYWRIELDSLRDSGRSVPPIVLTYVLKDDDTCLRNASACLRNASEQAA